MANFTPEEISEILAQFFDVVGKRQYIGARYVPIFGRKDEATITWDNTKPYEPLTIVLYQGNSYTSRQYVPAGVDITDEGYWALTGNYNAQVEQYRRDTAQVAHDLSDAVTRLEGIIDADVTDLENKVAGRVFAFDTVADMKASDELAVGSLCRTKGYNSVNDFGGAWYYVTDTGTADDMETIATGDLFAHYIYNGYATPQQFGALANGVANDTDAIATALKYKNVKWQGTYLTNAQSLEVDNELIIDLCGCTLKPYSVQTYLFNIKATEDHAKIEIRNGRIDGNRKVAYAVHLWGNQTYKTNFIAENLEIFNTDNSSSSTGSEGITSSVGIESAEVYNCYIHDIYRSFDNPGIHGSVGIHFSNVQGHVHIHDNVVENIHKSEGGSLADCDSISCFSTNTKASCEIDHNYVHNSQRRFLKFQMGNVNVHDNRFIQDVSCNLSYPFDYQRGAGHFDNNYVEINAHEGSDAEKNLFKVQFTEDNLLSICNNTFMINVASPLTHLGIIYTDTYTTANRICINVEDNYLKYTGAGILLTLNFVKELDKIDINVLNNYMSNMYRIFVVSSATSTNNAYKIYSTVVGNRTDYTGADRIEIARDNANLQNTWAENNGNFINQVGFSELDISKLRYCKLFNGSASAVTITNLPSGWSATMLNYKYFKCEQIAPTVLKLSSGYPDSSDTWVENYASLILS